MKNKKIVDDKSIYCVVVAAGRDLDVLAEAFRQHRSPSGESSLLIEAFTSLIGCFGPDGPSNTPAVTLNRKIKDTQSERSSKGKTVIVNLLKSHYFPSNFFFIQNELSSLPVLLVQLDLVCPCARA